MHLDGKQDKTDNRKRKKKKKPKATSKEVTTATKSIFQIKGPEGNARINLQPYKRKSQT